MDWLAQLDMDKFLLFTLVLTRVSGLTMTAPIYGSQEVPMQVRALLAFALAMLIVPTQWNVPLTPPGTMLNYLVLVGAELLIGFCLGTGVVILFSGIQMAGTVIGQVSGLMVAEVLDPTIGEQVSLFSRLMHLVALVVFVCIGGHRMVMAGLLDTFQSIPPGSAVVPLSMANTMVQVVAQSFVLGIRAAAPVAVAVLLATLVMGLIGRTLPQLNILAVGFGVNSMLAFGVLAVALGASVMVFQDQVEPTITMVLDALHEK
jgi:flagellar biosynthesis protein FliR